MLNGRKINMESIKQQGIMVYLNKKDKNKKETGNCQNGNEASIIRLIASVEQTKKRAYSDKLSVAGESKKQKEELVRQYDKKYF